MQLVKGAVRFCQKPLFWEFLSAKTGDIVTSQEEAAQVLRQLCGVRSRAALANDEAAMSRYIELVKDFNGFCQVAK